MALLEKVLPIQCAEEAKRPPEPISKVEILISDDPKVWSEIAKQRKRAPC